MTICTPHGVMGIPGDHLSENTWLAWKCSSLFLHRLWPVGMCTVMGRELTSFLVYFLVTKYF